MRGFVCLFNKIVCRLTAKTLEALKLFFSKWIIKSGFLLLAQPDCPHQQLLSHDLALSGPACWALQDSGEPAPIQLGPCPVPHPLALCGRVPPRRPPGALPLSTGQRTAGPALSRLPSAQAACPATAGPSVRMAGVVTRRAQVHGSGPGTYRRPSANTSCVTKKLAEGNSENRLPATGGHCCLGAELPLRAEGASKNIV